MPDVIAEPRERRYKTLWITPELLLNCLLFNHKQEGATVKIIRMEGLPEGYKVQDVYYDWQRNAFGFRLWHESFEVVEPCSFPPEVWPVFHCEYLPLARPSEEVRLFSKEEFLAAFKADPGHLQILHKDEGGYFAVGDGADALRDLAAFARAEAERLDAEMMTPEQPNDLAEQDSGLVQSLIEAAAEYDAARKLRGLDVKTAKAEDVAREFKVPPAALESPPRRGPEFL